MEPIVSFWLAALAVAVFAFPIAAHIFRRFPDAGAGLALPLGLMLLSSGYFLARVLDLLPHGRGGFLLALGVLGLVSCAVAGRDRRFTATISRSARPAFATLLLFTTLYLGYASFRSYESGIGGTEQPMDFLYLNAMLVSEDYPPADPWLSGETASYYYLGYLQSASLTAIAGVQPSEGYNLSLATLFASSGAAVASLASALTRWTLPRRRGALPVVGAGAGVLLLLFAGSWLGVFEVAAAHERGDRAIYEALSIEQLLPCEAVASGDCYRGPVDPRTNHWYPDEFWFWWRASRVIPGTITEFPAFSFILGDLHAHVMAIPATLLAAALAAALWRSRRVFSLDEARRQPFMALFLAVVFGGLAFQNAWDVVAFSSLLALAVIGRNLARERTLVSAGTGALYLAVPAALAIVFYLPWLLTFSSQAGGLYAYTGEGTIPAHLALQFGLPLATGTLLLFALRRMAHASFDRLLVASGVAIVPFLAWIALSAARGDWSSAVEQRGAGGWITLLFLAAIAWALAFGTLHAHRLRSPAVVPLGAAAVAVTLLYGGELLFIRDVFFEGVPRLNTVFKLSYQAWTLLSFSGAVGLALLIDRARRDNVTATALAAPIGALVLGSLVYVVASVPNRANGFDGPTSVDGLASLARSDADEYRLVRWIAANVPEDAIVVEASGRAWTVGPAGPELQDANVDYSDAGRVAFRTGRSVPIGWYFHEIQWRGDTEENRAAFLARQEDVDAIYMAESPAAALDLLRRYKATYVVMGHVEMSRYPESARTNFESFLDLVFQSGDVRVYRVPVYRVVATS